ncbi:MAG: hypothetical protein AVDCRST_MAG47-2653 [uncultured Nocardioidaceae bacterium]|uniref:Uncharacterized protein n=1 Tax=uncultured Nocardioidaceae bacterium TaxID=253824 RepID=A0A6J4NHT4_9ACTN|nr:MAG: hypothetical protein AVDCRST_MAG47-2653 [uncultured Nocardioidaceae bacterium]
MRAPVKTGSKPMPTPAALTTARAAAATASTRTPVVATCSRRATPSRTTADSRGAALPGRLYSTNSARSMTTSYARAVS